MHGSVRLYQRKPSEAKQRQHWLALLSDDYNWQVLKATNAALAQLEHFELRDRMTEGDRFQEDFNQLGVLIADLYADTGRPVGAE